MCVDTRWYGWTGSVLYVDLSKGKVVRRELRRDFARAYIGGRGFTSRAIWDLVPKGVDPLGPGNVLALAPGPLTGSGFPLTSRVEISSISAYSGILGDGNAGGFFPTSMKFAGLDMMVILGRAEKPVYLLVDGRHAEVRSAAHLWGKTTWETEEAIHADHGKDFSVASIGIAGENLVRVANTIVDKFNAGARGTGAVWGSKRLKAIAVRGDRAVEVAKPDEFERYVEMDLDFLTSEAFFREVVGIQGTLYGLRKWYPPVRHAETVLKEDEVPLELSPETYVERFRLRAKSCFGCPVHCESYYLVRLKGIGEVRGAAIEYETAAKLGTNLGLMRLEYVLYINNLAAMYGLDTVALGNALGYAFKLYETGILTVKETGGLALEWGDGDVIVTLIEMTARRKGIGELIAEGQHNMARMLAAKGIKEALKYDYHVKGLSRGMEYKGIGGLLNATSTRGADELRGHVVYSYTPYNIEWNKRLEERGDLPRDPVEKAIWGQRAFTLADMLQRCKIGFHSWISSHPLVYAYPLFVGPALVLSSVTGVSFTRNDLIEATDRVYTLERAILVRRGITRKHDYPPKAAFERGVVERADFEKMLDKYYRLRGWDLKTGVPSREVLRRLGLGDVADQLFSEMPYEEWEGPPLHNRGTSGVKTGVLKSRVSVGGPKDKTSKMP